MLVGGTRLTIHGTRPERDRDSERELIHSWGNGRGQESTHRPSANAASCKIIGPVRITSWYPKFNGSHFGLPLSAIQRMTGLGGNSVLTMMYLHEPLDWPLINRAIVMLMYSILRQRCPRTWLPCLFVMVTVRWGVVSTSAVMRCGAGAVYQALGAIAGCVAMSRSRGSIAVRWKTVDAVQHWQTWTTTKKDK